MERELLVIKERRFRLEIKGFVEPRLSHILL